MAKYRVVVDMYATTNLYITADSMEEANQKAEERIYDEDRFVETHQKEIYVYNPVIAAIVEE